MNNTERIMWLAGIFLLAFYSLNQNKQIANLEILYESNVLHGNIQSSQIEEIYSKIDEYKSSSYSQGFNDGESRAMISFLKDEPLNDYSDGYHAALSQFDLNDGVNPSNNDLYELLVSLLAANDQSLENYQDLLDLIDD